MKINVYTRGNACNTYLVTNNNTAIVIDAGSNSRDIFNQVEQDETLIKGVLLTHTHYDHIVQLEDYIDAGIPIYVHADEATWLSDASMNMSAMFGAEYTASKKPDYTLSDGQILNIDEMKIEVIHTPGHTPGGVCYKIGNDLFAGDTLFRQSVGRFDLPGGSGEAIMQSIKERLYTLDDETRVYPGHGPSTSIGYEKRNNPFVTV